jgi:type I restriction enzyme M protein
VEGQDPQKLLEMDLVEAVIGLAPNLFYGTGWPRASWSCAQETGRAQEQGADHRRLEPVPEGPRAELPRARAQRADRHAGTAASRMSRTRQGGRARRDQKEGWTLNISRYVLPPIGEDIPPLPEAVEAFKAALARCRAAEDHLRRCMVEGGWLQ